MKEVDWDRNRAKSKEYEWRVPFQRAYWEEESSFAAGGDIDPGGTRLGAS
jgi:hypothetical protein